MAICDECGKYRAQLHSRMKTGEDGSFVTENICYECGQTPAKGSIGCFVGVAVIIAPVLFLLGYCTSQRPSNTDTAAADAATSGEDTARSSLAVQALDAKVGGELHLKKILKDGESARFSDEFVSRLNGGNLMLCGKVNSKNSFDAFTGFKRFIASPNPDAPNMVEGEDIAGVAIDAKTFARAYAFACGNSVQRF